MFIYKVHNIFESYVLFGFPLDALKANLIEYESRYDLCKSDHQDTANQLEKLTEDFERLRSSMEASRSLAESNEEKLNVCFMAANVFNLQEEI